MPTNSSYANLRHIASDPSWSFDDCTQTQTRYLTHGYHTYPAKFIPQLAARLIREYSSEGDMVADPFMGSGTTVVEALIQRRVSVGVDINPVAYLIARVKSTPLEPTSLEKAFAELEEDLGADTEHAAVVPENERIDYWFPTLQKRKLGSLLGQITESREPGVREFFLVAFSQILKSSSIWLQRSIKPTRDLSKVPADPYDAFIRHARAMLKRNREFWEMLPAMVRENYDDYRVVECADARSVPVGDGAASLVVTSPPYVTSYEYADLHQLSALWFSYCDSLPEFRKRFIGTAHSDRSKIALDSVIAEAICRALKGRKAEEVQSYFSDMLECFREMWRCLRVGGLTCVVIGNTKLNGVDILNAEVFVEQMQGIGFRTHQIVKREIPSKILPPARNPQSGRFAPRTSAHRVLAYPVEYILVMEKAANPAGLKEQIIDNALP